VASFPEEPALAAKNYRPYLYTAAELEASYARCCSLGVPPGLARPRHVLPPDGVGSRLKAGAPLLTFANRIISPVCCASLQRHYIYVLCDPDLAALKIFAAPEVLAAAGEVGVRSGILFTEESCGTNALALAKEHQRLVAIRGEQHYCKLFKDWWCVASPVKDPNGKISGYLDISMHAEKELGLAAAHLQTLVARIEDGFLLAELRAHQRNGAAPAPFLPPPEVAEKLTPREREVLKLLLCGLSSKEIAARLHLSVSTVEDYRKRIYQKLGVRGGIKGLLALLNR
jgi:transcriptional regulator of acetoin/glycerol metabolism